MKTTTTLILLMLSNSIVSQKTFKDKRDGKIYKTVKIGNQIWMAENLAYKADSGCRAYEDSLSNVSKYGYLYDWEAAQNVCPTGWKLPSKADFETLLNNYGGSSGDEANYKALIPTGKSGFSALFGGVRFYNNTYYNIGDDVNFWSSTPDDFTTAFLLTVISAYKAALIYSDKVRCGFSVRCLRN
jgi:uncharacterized protein (TIGR02145 family)